MELEVLEVKNQPFSTAIVKLNLLMSDYYCIKNKKFGRA